MYYTRPVLLRIAMVVLRVYIAGGVVAMIETGEFIGDCGITIQCERNEES